VTEVFKLRRGATPLLISIPHDGRALAPGMAERMTVIGRALPDTDWHVRRLYEFASELGAGVIAANYSRYVVDLNRPANDTTLYPGQLTTGLCPLQTFGGDPIYAPGESVTPAEQSNRIRQYWRPYHDALARELVHLVGQFGYALLWDAHSIPGEVPLLFDGALPDLNIGTNGGASCSPAFEAAIAAAAGQSPYTSVVNGRFRGGYITRRYGRPAAGIHAVQLELSQRNYMDETSRDYLPERAGKLSDAIRNMLTTFTKTAESAYSG
jgi:N-formylglutamate deformylase